MIIALRDVLVIQLSMKSVGRLPVFADNDGQLARCRLAVDRTRDKAWRNVMHAIGHLQVLNQGSQLHGRHYGLPAR
jgi:hypothetical protein